MHAPSASVANRSGFPRPSSSRSPNLTDSTAPPQPRCPQDFPMTRMTGQPHRDLLSFCFFSVVLYGTWFL